jgi:hypothetical protein
VVLGRAVVLNRHHLELAPNHFAPLGLAAGQYRGRCTSSP